MSDSLGRSYPAVGGAQILVNIPLQSCPGTAAAIAAVANGQVNFPIACKVRSARAYVKTGGTAAGPVVLLQKSVDGTGTWTTFGSAAMGTDADDTLKTFSLTETAFDAGDVLRVAVGAGTVAATPVIHICVAVTEEFVSA